MIKLLEKNRILALTITFLIALEIFYFSSIPGSTVTGNPWVARAYHSIVFFLFSFFLFITIKGNKQIKIKQILVVFFISVLYAVSDEFHQTFVLLRDASFNDFLTDLFGVLLSISIYSYISKKSEKF